MNSVFISYNHQDKLKANSIAKCLKKASVNIWLDALDLHIGSSLIKEISLAIEKTDFVAALISYNSIKSPWVEKELSLAMTKEINGKKIVVLPIKIDACEIPAYLADKLYADLSGTRDIYAELGRIVKAIKPDHGDIIWPNLELMYQNEEWQTILMIQAFADRREWGGPSYHCVNPRRRLKKILKVFGAYKHPIEEQQGVEMIENSIERILELDPDILGIGGMGRTGRKIESELKNRNFGGIIGYWGGDAGKDACEFLEKYEIKNHT